MPKKDELFKKYNKLTPDQKEILLISENNYSNKFYAISDNYRRKIKSGKYDYEKSIKGYLNFVTPIRRRMNKEYPAYNFKPSDDKKVAEVLALQFYEANLDNIKKMNKKLAMRNLNSDFEQKLMDYQKKYGKREEKENRQKRQIENMYFNIMVEKERRKKSKAKRRF